MSEIDYTLAEHPRKTRERLRATGEWSAADKLWRSERSLQYIRVRDERGYPGKLNEDELLRVNKAAWDRVHEKYPPPDDAEPLLSLRAYLVSMRTSRRKTLVNPSEEDQARWDAIGDSGDAGGEIVWVHNNIDKLEASPGDCPSRGAWTLLERARADKLWFYEKMYRPFAQQLAKQQSAAEDGEYKPSKAEKLACEDIRRLIEEAVAESVA